MRRLFVRPSQAGEMARAGERACQRACDRECVSPKRSMTATGANRRSACAGLSFVRTCARARALYRLVRRRSAAMQRYTALTYSARVLDRGRRAGGGMREGFARARRSDGAVDRLDEFAQVVELDEHRRAPRDAARLRRRHVAAAPLEDVVGVRAHAAQIARPSTVGVRRVRRARSCGRRESNGI